MCGWCVYSTIGVWCVVRVVLLFGLWWPCVHVCEQVHYLYCNAPFTTNDTNCILPAYGKVLSCALSLLQSSQHILHLLYHMYMMYTYYEVPFLDAGTSMFALFSCLEWPTWEGSETSVECHSALIFDFPQVRSLAFSILDMCMYQNCH